MRGGRRREKDYKKDQPCKTDQLRNPETGHCAKCKGSTFLKSDLQRYARRLGINVHPRDEKEDLCDKIFANVGLQGQNQFDQLVSNLLGVESVMQQVLREHPPPPPSTMTGAPLGFASYRAPGTAGTFPAPPASPPSPPVASFPPPPVLPSQVQAARRPAPAPSARPAQQAASFDVGTRAPRVPRMIRRPFVTVERDGVEVGSPPELIRFFLAGPEIPATATLDQVVARVMANVRGIVQFMLSNGMTLEWTQSGPPIIIDDAVLDIIERRVISEKIRQGESLEVEIKNYAADVPLRGVLRFGSRDLQAPEEAPKPRPVPYDQSEDDIVARMKGVSIGAGGSGKRRAM